MTDPGLESALWPVIDVFERLEIDYRIGGSVASTILGVPRSTIDVDVACDDEYFRRRTERALGESPGSRTYRIVTAEDIILLKLEWYQAGGRTSERQWGDVLGVMRVQAGELDSGYLRHRAKILGIEELLLRAIGESEES